MIAGLSRGTVHILILYNVKNGKLNAKNVRKLFLSCTNNLTLVPVSQWLSDLLNDSFFKNTEQTVIHNGIDTDIFSPQRKNNNFRNLENKFVILGVAGVWEKRKGLEDFFELSTLLGEDEIILLIGLSELQIKQLPANIIGLKRTENVQQLAELLSKGSCILFVQECPYL